MDRLRIPLRISSASRVVLAGAAIAAVLGAEAGAALRPGAQERGAPPPPQLIVAPDATLMALEQAGAGWPGREPG